MARNKVYMLGGAGFMATPMTLDLAAHMDDASIGEIVIGDIDRAKAEALARQIGDERVRAELIDITAEDDAARKISGSSLLVNCLFYGLDPNALSVACKAKVDYTSINGWAPPDKEKDDMCRAAGIRAIGGAGADPTMVVLLGKKGAAELDTVEELHSYFCSFRNIAPSPGLLETIFWENGPACPDRNFYLNGRFVNAGPFEGSKRVKLPDPVGERVVTYQSEAEVVDWSVAFPGAKLITRRGVWRPDVQRDIEAVNRLGLQDNVELEYQGHKINVADFVRKAVWRKLGGKSDRRHPWGYMYVVEIIGTRDGQPEKVVYSMAHPDWQEQSTSKMVGISAAANALLLLKKGRDKIGALNKYDYYSLDDIEWLIREFSDRGIIINEIPDVLDW